MENQRPAPSAPDFVDPEVSTSSASRQPSSGTNSGMLAIVIVTYFPEASKFSQLLRNLSTGPAELVIVVDNTDDLDVASLLRQEAEISEAIYISEGRNLGIAAALNFGVRRAQAVGADLVWLLDQDSGASPQLLKVLREALERARSRSDAVVAVGPNSYDHRDGLRLVPRFSALGPTLRHARQIGSEMVQVPYLVSSGTLLHVPTWELVGEFRDDYFIDHVDYEWGVRATLAGYQLFAAGAAEMPHELARIVKRKGGGTMRVHGQSTRRYYQVRNYFLLQRDLKVPLAWRFGLLLLTAQAIARVFWPISDLRNAAKYVLAGVSDGLRNKRGQFIPEGGHNAPTS